MYTARLFIELTPTYDGDHWNAGDAADFTVKLDDYGYRVTACEVDADDDGYLLARIEKDFDELVFDVYDGNDVYREEVNQEYFENVLGDDIDDAYFDFGHVEILEFEVVEG